MYKAGWNLRSGSRNNEKHSLNSQRIGKHHADNEGEDEEKKD